MPVSTEQERILLNKYHLTSLHPTEWPHENDDDNSSEEEEEERGASKASLSNGHARNMSTSSNSARYQKISRHASIEGRKHTDAGIQKDEPDALGKAQSVVSELRRRGLPVEENSALRNKFMLSSTSFNPGLYLTQVHQDATMSDLMRGLDFLSKGIEQKSASLKVLVESNFERFVRAKATIDAVYTEMRTQGVEPQPVSQGPGSLSASHSRQTSRNHTHFRNTSGAFSVQSKTPTVDKRKNALTKESDYGVQGIKIPLHEVMIKADEVWGPALGGREREETLKSVVLALDHHRDVIQLSGTVFEAIQKNDYDGVAEAHKQATQHAEKARRIADTAKRNNVDLRDGEVQQIIITAKMWHDVSQQIESFKSQIWRRLKTSHGRKTTVQTSEPDKEEHMELIGVLMRLDVDENPIWEWINSRFLYLKNEMTRFFERSRVEIEILRRKLANGRPTDNEALARHLRSASAAAGNLRRSKETSRDMDVTMVLAFWDKVHASLTTLLSPQTGILGEIVEWWETAQSFIDGKAQKAFPTAVFNAGLEHLELDPDHVQNIRLGAVELVTTLRESIMSFFSDAPVEDLGDLYSPMPPTPITPGSAKAASPGSKRSFNFDMSNIPPPPSPRRGDVLDKFAFWAPNSNSLSGSHYLGRLLALVGSGASELAGLSVIRQGSNETEKMKTLVGTVRERCIQAICVSWNADAEKCRVLESWQLNAERRDITLMPAYYAAWEEQVLANVQKIAYISDAATRKGGANGIDVIFPPPAKLLQAVKGCFVTSLYKALSGMVENAEKMKNDGSVDADADGVVVARQPTVAEDGVQATEVVDASNKVCHAQTVSLTPESGKLTCPFSCRTYGCSSRSRI